VKSQKLQILDYINQIYLGYTVVEVGWWQQLIVPKLASGRTDHAQVLPLEASPHTTIYGDGNVKIGLTHLRDIGRYVARIIADPRTLNKKVYVYGELATQNEAVALMEKVSGEKIEMKHVSHTPFYY
jgi:nucleoside-diphosphate-sugar epimerase